jgi:hypothetical protein
MTVDGVLRAEAINAAGRIVSRKCTTSRNVPFILRFLEDAFAGEFALRFPTEKREYLSN